MIGRINGGEPRLILDLSRLLSRVDHPTPTGVDRVEMAYARGLLALAPERLCFAAFHPFWRHYGRLPMPAVLEFLAQTEARWRDERHLSRVTLLPSALLALCRLPPRRADIGSDPNAIYIQPSPNNLTKPALVASILRRERARMVCMIHDLIPLQYPEYARAGGARRHARRIDTVVRHASGILCNSHATLAALEPYLDRAGKRPAVAVAHLGTEPGIAPASRPRERPYFVCIGTIEPRKNHLLLLNLWRHMSEHRGAANIPALLLIGRRGWENEQVVDMLERCPALRGCVEEHQGLPDRAMQHLLAGANALLLPSFAEGYGMPVGEAIALDVPVLCSDLPALREAGGAVPDFLDPLDGPGWQRAIDDLTGPVSAIAHSQRERRQAWQAPTWHDHIAILTELLHKLPA